MSDAPNQRQPFTPTHFVGWAWLIGSGSLMLGLTLLLGVGGFFLAVAIAAYLVALITLLEDRQ